MKISRGKVKMPYLLLAYGIDGIGKSTFASRAPDPIFVGPEKGTNNLDVARVEDVDSPETLYMALRGLHKENFKTLVIDTIDWIEHMFAIKIGGDSKCLSKACGGYGAGYETLLSEFMKFRGVINSLREEKGMNIIMLAHCNVVDFNDPETDTSYNRYVLKLTETKNVSIGGFFREWVDDVLFMNYVVFSKGEGKAARGVSARERKMWTERMPSFDAKNRSGLPFEMPLDWSVYQTAKTFGAVPQEEAVGNRINDLILELKDEKLKAIVTDTLSKSLGNLPMLKKIEQKLLQRKGVRT